MGAHVAGLGVAGEPRKALTSRRLSLKTNALAPACHATYCPPSEAGQARCRSGTNDAMISIGRMASTSSSIITAGLLIEANTVCFTVNVSYAYVMVTPSGRTTTT